MDRAGEAEAAEGGAPGTLRPAARANYREYIDRINAEQRVIVQAAVDKDPNMAYWVYQPLPHYEEAVPPSEVVTKTEKGDGKPDPASKNHDAAVKSAMDTYNARLVQLRQERKDLVDERIRLKNKVSEAEAAYVEADERLTVKIHEISLTEQERSDVYHKAKRQKRWDAGEDIDV